MFRHATFALALATLPVIAAVGSHAQGATPTPLPAGELEVTITGIRDAAGTVRIALYAGADGFMKPEGLVGAAFMRARSGTMRFVFAGLDAGDYAAAIFHDANDNGDLDTNLLGLPTEGVAFSAEATASFGPPSFVAAAVAVPVDGRAATAATLSYGFAN